jgi:hypothetical protein
VKSKKLVKGKSITSEYNGIMVMKCREKSEVFFITTFHDKTMQMRTLRDAEVPEAKCIKQ